MEMMSELIMKSLPFSTVGKMNVPLQLFTKPLLFQMPFEPRREERKTVVVFNWLQVDTKCPSQSLTKTCRNTRSPSVWLLLLTRRRASYCLREKAGGH
ncbi:uncharacterized protein BDZ99DRAFT_125284 [Mytilinidion resinicola]|uniref:Uncharacterized protein n=1 Tax=Mytilinidion resinicola TaxID=574789 RepID=A0A6A6Z6K7_9PEZI|nr:uncharacterized protein BDZ99DRAFT_125284 [Mytilinidion resinicola]KAF2815897.1 hypothetical protein BDZ99DRAFT_125284 [Mytilinidion resinicola]